MQIKFWGSRGSIPNSMTESVIRAKLVYALDSYQRQLSSGKLPDIEEFIDSLPFMIRSTYGSNTPCVEIKGGTEIIVCDAGTGIKELGSALLSDASSKNKVINLLLSHLHWDHIQGFPFFTPAYIQGYRIKIWSGHESFDQALQNQQMPPYFPVKMEDMGSTISFHRIHPGEPFNIGGIDILPEDQPHPGISFGYAFTQKNQKFVYSTDVELSYDDEELQKKFKAFYQDADVLIVDGQFNLADHLYTKQYWGHSSNLMTIEMALESNVKTLCLFHSEHTYDDLQFDKFYQDSIRYNSIYAPDNNMKILMAYDGLLI